MELSALMRVKIMSIVLGCVDPILFKLAGNNDMLNILDKFEF